jgi:iron-sulfur cluster insertion protein
MPDGATPETSQSLTLTDSCAKRIAKLREMEGNGDLMLRVSVLGGGCSGFQYKFGLDDVVNDDDLTFELNGTRVVTDEISLELLGGSVVDFKEDLGGSFFSVENPNATANCGCGSSFNI